MVLKCTARVGFEDQYFSLTSARKFGSESRIVVLKSTTRAVLISTMSGLGSLLVRAKKIRKQWFSKMFGGSILRYTVVRWSACGPGKSISGSQNYNTGNFWLQLID